MVTSNLRGGIGNCEATGNPFGILVASSPNLGEIGTKKMSEFEMKKAAAEMAIEAKSFAKAIEFLEEAKKLAPSPAEKGKCTKLINSLKKEEVQPMTTEPAPKVSVNVPVENRARRVLELNRIAFFARNPRVRSLPFFRGEVRNLKTVLDEEGINWESDFEVIRDKQWHVFNELNSTEEGRQSFLDVVTALLENKKIPDGQFEFVEILCQRIERARFSDRRREKREAAETRLHGKLQKTRDYEVPGARLSDEEKKRLLDLREAKNFKKVCAILKNLPKADSEDYERFVTSRLPGCATLKSYRETPEGVSEEMIFHLHHYADENLGAKGLVKIEEIFKDVSNETLKVIRDSAFVHGAKVLLLHRRRNKQDEAKPKPKADKSE